MLNYNTTKILTLTILLLLLTILATYVSERKFGQPLRLDKRSVETYVGQICILTMYTQLSIDELL